jgi:hypothetical protein
MSNSGKYGIGMIAERVEAIFPGDAPGQETDWAIGAGPGKPRGLTKLSSNEMHLRAVSAWMVDAICRPLCR